MRNSIKNLYADKSKVSEELIACYFELCLRAGNRRAFLDEWRKHLMDSSYQRIPTIHHQTLILWGSEDHFIPVDRANEFHRDLANDTLIVLPNNGHMPVEESLQITVAIVLDFISKN